MIIKILLIWSCGLLFLLIVGQCFVPEKTCKNISLALLSIICGVWFLNTTFYYFGVHKILPHLNKVHIPFVCITGTSWYFYIKCYTEKYVIKRNDYLHLIPAAICILLGMPFYLEPAAFKVNYIETEFINLSSVLMYVASRISELNSAIYIVLSLLLVRKHIRSENTSSTKQTYYIMYYITIIAIFTLVLRTFGSVSNLGFVGIALPSIIIFFLFTLLYGFSYYNPSILGITELKKTNNKSNSNQYVENIQAQMAIYQEIIERDKLYLDANITVTGLAKHLNTQPYILSDVINASMNINFNTFINNMRIEHAAKMLIEDKTATVLDIAYASGFNSKSVFYKHFFEVKTMTPIQYRKTMLKNIPNE
jgi:AraC-like DNA-binding protein